MKTFHHSGTIQYHSQNITTKDNLDFININAPKENKNKKIYQGKEERPIPFIYNWNFEPFCIFFVS